MGGDGGPGPAGPDNNRRDGRLEDGRFGPGNKFSPGNPLNRRIYAMRSAMLAAVDRGTIEAAARSLGAQAAGGDLQAIKLLFEYCCGKPAQAVEVSGPAGEPLGRDRLAAVILATLEGYPEARFAVAAELRKLDRGDAAAG